MTIDPNAPAYPSTPAFNGNGDYVRPVDIGCEGLSIRACIASRIMAGMAANPEIYKAGRTDAEMAAAAVVCADALISELNKPKA